MRALKAGTLRKLASRVYTRNLTDIPEAIVLRNLWSLVGGLLPGALVADRTALENRPAADGSIFVIADHKRDLVLPGITLRPRKGPPLLPTDRPFIAGLHIASLPRAFLENMRPSRARSGVAPARCRRRRSKPALRPSCASVESSLFSASATRPATSRRSLA